MRSRFKWAGAFIASIVVLAVLSGSALAEVWETGAFKFTAGQSENFRSKIKSEKFLIEGQVVGKNLKLMATGIECLECKAIQVGEGESGVAEGAARYKFTGLTVIEPKGCKTPSTFTTKPLVETYVPRTGFGLLEYKGAEGTGTKLGSILIEGCEEAEAWPLTGTLDGRTSQLGVIFVAPTVTFSLPIEEEEGGGLQIGGKRAAITGELSNELSGTNEGRMWGVAAK